MVFSELYNIYVHVVFSLLAIYARDILILPTSVNVLAPLASAVLLGIELQVHIHYFASSPHCMYSHIRFI